MRTPANIARHPIHPMLVPIAVGLWIFSLVCDLVHRFGSANPNWEVVAWYTLVGGIVGALIAAVPGFIDMLSLPWRTKRIALVHMSDHLALRHRGGDARRVRMARRQARLRARRRGGRFGA